MTPIEDYNLFLQEQGITDAKVHETMASSEYLGRLDNPNLRLGKSDIHGLGVFVEPPRHYQDFCKLLILLRTELGKPMFVGRYINHSNEPNLIPVIGNDGCVFAVNNQLIKASVELTLNYRDVVSTLRHLNDDT